MGVFISLHVSNKVDPEQWEKAYEETLVLVDAFNLIEIQKFEKFGCKYFAEKRKKGKGRKSRGW